MYFIALAPRKLSQEMKRILQKGAGKRSDNDIRFLEAFLKYNDFFFDLAKMKDPSTLDQCYRNISLEFCPKSQFVFHFGEKGERFYVILKGEVSVLLPREVDFPKDDKLGAPENMTEIKRLKMGSSFGELALFSNKPRTASIMAVEDCHFAVLRKKDFKKILGTNRFFVSEELQGPLRRGKSSITSTFCLGSTSSAGGPSPN